MILKINLMELVQKSRCLTKDVSYGRDNLLIISLMDLEDGLLSIGLVIMPFIWDNGKTAATMDTGQ